MLDAVISLLPAGVLLVLVNEAFAGGCELIQDPWMNSEARWCKAGIVGAEAGLAAVMAVLMLARIAFALVIRRVALRLDAQSFALETPQRVEAQDKAGPSTKARTALQIHYD